MNLRQTTRRRAEAGYAMMMVVFLVATIIIFSAAVVPNLLIQGRREREEETVWRGKQYARAIGLYFRKLGRYPTKVEDLTRETNGVRVLRQAYSDPMNKGDGSWRFIYVGPNGQLIGSLRRVSLLQSLMATPTLPGATSAAALAQQGANPGGPPGSGALGAGALPANPPNPATTPNPLESQPQPLTGAVMGGKHHWGGQQGETVIAAGLSGRRYLRAVGVHLESGAADRYPWPTTARWTECAPALGPQQPPGAAIGQPQPTGIQQNSLQIQMPRM